MIVLKVVYDNVNRRDIIFSSFHPDICMMLALKQPNIPILFLTESGSEEMADIRATSLQQAIRFASRWSMLGIVSECSVFQCTRLVRVVKESGLVCFTYGDDNDDKVFVRKQIEAGVDAVIVDSVLAIGNDLTKGDIQNRNGL
jgi:glycerophosphodiester phosphodiesterase